jgi:hypothetical protein
MSAPIGEMPERVVITAHCAGREIAGLAVSQIIGAGGADCYCGGESIGISDACQLALGTLPAGDMRAMQHSLSVVMSIAPDRALTVGSAAAFAEQFTRWQVSAEQPYFASGGLWYVSILLILKILYGGS